MDDINVIGNKTLVQKLTGTYKVMGLRPMPEFKQTVAMPGGSPPSEPITVPCLLHEENVKGRYVALKSVNERQVVAAGFTRHLAYKRAVRKGYSSCIVIPNY